LARGGGHEPVAGVKSRAIRRLVGM
jgi:hypothetical protein